MLLGRLKSLVMCRLTSTTTAASMECKITGNSISMIDVSKGGTGITVFHTAMYWTFPEPQNKWPSVTCECVSCAENCTKKGVRVTCLRSFFREELAKGLCKDSGQQIALHSGRGDVLQGVQALDKITRSDYPVWNPLQRSRQRHWNTY